MRLSRMVRLGLIHVAVATTLVPINSTLNRIMISELGLPATLVAVLVALPYLCSPIQVWIGGYSDTHPLFGYRRTPYILLGLLLCVGGAALAPTAAFLLAEQFWQGLLVGLLAFGAWGLGFSCSTVSYLSLASDLAGEQDRARTIGVMWFMLIVGVIVAGIGIGRALTPYSDAKLFTVFYETCAIALVMGLIGLFRLEPRGGAAGPGERRSLSSLLLLVGANRQARLFFVYLVLLLIALLGQDLLLEPFAADVFGTPPGVTSRYVSIWGVALLVALLLTGPLSRWVGNSRCAAIGSALAGVGLLLIALSGAFRASVMFMPGLVVFGLGSGISTAANLALMLDMTVPGQVGMFMGAWGMADALARLCGTLLSGVVRDGVIQLSGDVAAGYVTVFLIEALALVVTLVLLQRISVARFQHSAARGPTELSALLGEVQGG